MLRQEAVMLNSPAVWLPDHLAEAWQLKQQLRSDACFIAGGTLMQTQWQKGVECPRNLISLERINEMQGCEKAHFNGKTGTCIGALTTLAALTEDLSLHKQIPLLEAAVRNIAAPAIRNRATIGGNISGGFGDLIPALLALDAAISFYDDNGILLKELSNCLSKGYSSDGKILTSIYIPENGELDHQSFFYKKLGFREAFSPSIVTISGCCQLNEQKEVKHIRLAAVGGTTPPQRLTECEKIIKGLPLTNELLQTFFQGIKDEFQAATDVFTTADYKKTVAANMMVSKIASIAG